MKTQSLMVLVMLSCLLILTSACGKKSARGVSGINDHDASVSQTEGMGPDQDLYGQASGLSGETRPGDGSDDGTIAALSAADLGDEQGGTGLAGGEQKGATSAFSALMRSDVSGSSGGAFGTEHDKAMSRDQSADAGRSSVAQESAWKQDARVSKALGDVFFTYDSWRLSETSQRILEANAEWLKAHTHARITIEGHCDERGTQAYNYVLGERRAQTAKQYLSNLGVPSHQMVVVSFGKDRPVCHVLNASCFQSNRRAHFSMDVNTASRD